jgi:YebC/PmpR family DNA-binding regulatory protein
MSGHNKWSKIKHKKAATDAQKSKIFSKLVKLIQLEAKKSNGDISSPGLKTAIEKARKENMPNDNIERAIKKASESGDMVAVMYEAYGPGGVGMIITGLTDNTNRTSQEVKHIFSKMNGSFGAAGSVSWNFHQNEERDWVPNSYIEIDEETGEKLENLIETLEDHDDIQDIYHNVE